MHAIQKVDPVSAIERLVILGDLSQLNPDQRARYYVEVCGSLGLNHLTRPFSYLRLNGKDVLYANRDCTDQLRKRDRVSVTVVGRERTEDLIIVTARATLPDGRSDEAIGAVTIQSLKGEALANALMKAETKAKRRATLSICGLGFLDESEIEDAQATDNGASDQTYGHDSPDAEPKTVDMGEYHRSMEKLRELDAAVFDPGCTWETMTKWRARIGSKGQPTEWSKQLSELYRGNISPDERHKLSQLWNRVDRKLTQLEGKLKPPPVEASFTDDPDETDVFAPSGGDDYPEPGSNG